MLDFNKQTFEQVIPENLLKDPKVRHLARSLQKHIDEVTSWSKRLNYTQNLHDLPDEILDHLLWEKHIGWDEGLALATTRQQKINLIETAIELHRTKGTPYAIEKVLASLDLDGKVIEWNEYGGEPYHFKVSLDINWAVNIHILKMLIQEYKNERSWIDNLTFIITDRPIYLVDHHVFLKKKLEPETSWFGGRYNPSLGSIIDGSWRINNTKLLNPSLAAKEDSINRVVYQERKKIEKVYNEYEENLALLIDGNWSLDNTYTLDNPARFVKLRPIKHEVSIFERKIYERVIDGTWYLDGSLTVGVQRLMNGNWDMDGEFLMDGDRTKDL